MMLKFAPPPAAHFPVVVWETKSLTICITIHLCCCAVRNTLDCFRPGNSIIHKLLKGTLYKSQAFYYAAFTFDTSIFPLHLHHYRPSAPTLLSVMQTALVNHVFAKAKQECKHSQPGPQQQPSCFFTTDIFLFLFFFFFLIPFPSLLFSSLLIERLLASNLGRYSGKQ